MHMTPNLSQVLYSMLDTENEDEYFVVTGWVQRNKLDALADIPQGTAEVVESLYMPQKEGIYKLMPWYDDGFCVITQDGLGIYFYSPQLGWSSRIQASEFINYVFPWRGMCFIASLKGCILYVHQNAKQLDQIHLNQIAGLENLETLNKAYPLDDHRLFITGTIHGRTVNGVIHMDSRSLEWLKKAEAFTGGRIIRHNGYDIVVDYKMLKVFSNNGIERMISVIPVERRSVILPVSTGLLVLLENWKLIKYDMNFKPLYQICLKESLTLDHLSYSPTFSYAEDTAGKSVYISSYYATSINKIRISDHV